MYWSENWGRQERRDRNGKEETGANQGTPVHLHFGSLFQGPNHYEFNERKRPITLREYDWSAFRRKRLIAVRFGKLNWLNDDQKSVNNLVPSLGSGWHPEAQSEPQPAGIDFQQIHAHRCDPSRLPLSRAVLWNHEPSCWGAKTKNQILIRLISTIH